MSRVCTIRARRSDRHMYKISSCIHIGIRALLSTLYLYYVMCSFPVSECNALVGPADGGYLFAADGKEKKKRDDTRGSEVT